jgi:site-specific recombinase XerD
MSETPINPLRQRMTEDMTVRKLGAATQRSYIRAVKTLSEFLGRSPATATPEDLRRFQVHQSAAGAQPPVMNSTVTARRSFFFRVTLDRRWRDRGRCHRLIADRFSTRSNLRNAGAEMRLPEEMPCYRAKLRRV